MKAPRLASAVMVSLLVASGPTSLRAGPCQECEHEQALILALHAEEIERWGDRAHLLPAVVYERPSDARTRKASNSRVFVSRVLGDTALLEDEDFLRDIKGWREGRSVSADKRTFYRAMAQATGRQEAVERGWRSLCSPASPLTVASLGSDAAFASDQRVTVLHHLRTMRTASDRQLVDALKRYLVTWGHARDIVEGNSPSFTCSGLLSMEMGVADPGPKALAKCGVLKGVLACLVQLEVELAALFERAKREGGDISSRWKFAFLDKSTGDFQAVVSEHGDAPPETRVEWRETPTHRIKIKFVNGAEVGRWEFPKSK